MRGVTSDDFQEEITQYQEEVAQYLDTMSHRAYAEHETSPFPPYMGNPYGSQYYDRYVHPAGLPGPPMTTLSVPLVDPYHSSSSARAYASSPPYSDTTTLVASPCTSNWDSPIPESYEDTSMYPHQAQRSYGNPVDSPVHSPLPHVVYARHPSTSLHSRGLYSASGSVTTRDYLASGYVADGPPRVGNRELQHDGGRSAAMYDTCHGWDIGVAADASTTASTSTASYDSAPNSATLPQSKTRSGRGRRSRQETSEPDVGAPSLAKPFACAYDDCKYVTDRTHNLRQHVDNVHANLRPHKCITCGQSFKREFDLKRHRISYHTAMGSPRRKDSEGKTATARRGN